MTTKKGRTRLAIAAAAAIWLLGGCSDGAPAGEIRQEAVVAWIEAPDDAPLLLDVRSSGEFASGHIPGSVNIPHDQLEARLGELDTDRGVVVYCESGGRAGIAIQTLEAAGFGDVGHLEGDMSGWRAAGLETASVGADS